MPALPSFVPRKAIRIALYLAHESHEYNANTISVLLVAEADSFRQYIAALYWSTMTVTTIGYGDPSAKTHTERIIATVLMFFGGALYAYVVGSICGLVSSVGVRPSSPLLLFVLFELARSYMQVQNRSFTHSHTILPCASLQMDEATGEFRRTMDHLNSYMQERNLPDNMRV